MERGGSSNQDDIRYQYNRRPKSGIVIQESNASANIPTDGRHPNLEQRPKREPDQYMPIANVIRIMRRVLPPNAKIAEDVKEIMLECITEFITCITSEANSKCNQEYRKTVTPEDVLKAMGTLGLDNYAETMTFFLKKYRGQDLEPAPTPPLQIVRHNRPNIVQHPIALWPHPPPAPPLPPPPPPPDMSVAPYMPMPPTWGGTNYSGFSVMNNYFTEPTQGGGGGCSKDMEEFDPFNHFQ